MTTKTNLAWNEFEYPLNYYKISNSGRIKNRQTNTFVQLSQNKNGFKTINLEDTRGYYHKFLISNLVAHYFKPRPADKYTGYLAHIDGDSSNSHVDNLEWRSRPVSPYLVKIKFWRRPVHYPVTSYWKPGNILCIPSTNPLSKGEKQRICDLLAGQDNSGRKPFIAG